MDEKDTKTIAAEDAQHAEVVPPRQQSQGEIQVAPPRDYAAPKAKTEQPKYRDRASERRIMHNQPDIPLPETSAAKSTAKKRFADAPPPPPSPPPAPVNPGEDHSNVGNKLLRAMGWTEGKGLGQDGEAQAALC